MTQPAHHPQCNCDQLAALVAELARRVEVQAVLLDITQERMVADSLLLGTDSTHLPQPGEITAATRRSDEATCAALAELIWTPAERLAFHAMRADADGEQR